MSDPEIDVPVEEPAELAIYFYDLSPETQEIVAEMMGCEVDEVVGHTNWDTFPMSYIYIHPIEEGGE